MKLNVIILNGLAAGAFAMPTTNSAVHEKRDVASGPWTKMDAINANARIPVRIALKQRNLENGMAYLMKVSDPKSPDYGKHYSQQEVISLFSPEQKTADAVTNWLVNSGIPKSSISLRKSQGWIAFETTASKLESLLKTTYHEYSHVDRKGTYVGTDQYTLPATLSGHIDFVTPGVAFASKGNSSRRSKRQPFVPMTSAKKTLANSSSDCGSTITPQCILDMYNVPAPSTAQKGNQLGIYEETGEEYAQEDLDQFYAEYATGVPQGTAPQLASINNASAPTDPAHAGGESDLDFEIAVPLIHPQSTVLYEVAGVQDTDDLFNSFLDAVDGSYCASSDQGDCGTFKPVPVISFSYGEAEADLPTNLLQRQCNEYMKLGLQGTTIVFASGDDGVARRSGGCLGSSGNAFAPDAEGGCPYITAVGSTTLPAGSKPGDAETATTSFSSGGGFSNINTTPDYQKDAVASYFSKHDPGYAHYTTSNGTIPDGDGIYNRGGRGYPDLSAVGDNGAVIVRGKDGTSGGTSMSAPLVAALFTRVNEERFKAGKGPIGFVNPTLYQHPEIFNDITVGNQDKGGPNGDRLPSACGNSGFSAVEGWDPVTGLGTPNYPALLKVFSALQ